MFSVGNRVHGLMHIEQALHARCPDLKVGQPTRVAGCASVEHGHCKSHNQPSQQVPLLSSLCGMVILTRCTGRRQMRSWRNTNSVARALARQEILVVGGGIAGFNLALRLAEMPWRDSRNSEPPRISMVDPKDRFVFTPLLIDYAVSDQISLNEFAPTYTDLLRLAAEEHIQTVPGTRRGEIEHVRGNAVSIDWRRREVHIRSQEDSVHYKDFDSLVICPGILGEPTNSLECSADLEAVQSFASLDDAERLRERLASGPPQSVAVVGAGYVGVELAAALAEAGVSTVALFGSTLLRGAEPANQKVVEERLKDLGVIRKSGRVRAIQDGGLEWNPTDAPKEALPIQHSCDLILLTGAAATPVTGCSLKPALDRKGSTNRIVVDEYLRAAPGIYCLGDAASAADAAPTGQAAMQQAEVAAWNVFAQISRLPRTAWRRYKPSVLGEFVALGRDSAAAVVDPTQLTKLLPPALPPTAAAAVAPLLAASVASASTGSKVGLGGRAAALLRRLSYLYRMPTLTHRAKVAKEWASGVQDSTNSEKSDGKYVKTLH